MYEDITTKTKDIPEEEYPEIDPLKAMKSLLDMDVSELSEAMKELAKWIYNDEPGEEQKVADLIDSMSNADPISKGWCLINDIETKTK